MQDNVYAFTFTAGICLVCALAVSVSATVLKDAQELNKQVDQRKNVLQVVGLLKEGEEHSPKEVQSLYEEKIKPMVIDGQGNVVEGVTPEEVDFAALAKKPNLSVSEQRYPLYEYIEDGAPQAYCIPVSGQGLWSTLYGYLALGPDAATVVGITFYEHGETPGLGAEIAEPWFKDQFRGKKIYDIKNNLVSVTVVKGEAPDDAEHEVDGISGATITSNAVTMLLRKDLAKYEPFLRQVRQTDAVARR